MKIKIWHFGLHHDLPITILAAFRPDLELFRQYGVCSTDSHENVLKAYLESIRAYKVNGIGGFYSLLPRQFARDESPHDFQRFFQMLQYVVGDLEYRHFRIPSLAFRARSDKPVTDEHLATTYYPAFVRYLRTRGWLGKAIVKEWDEPKESDAAAVFRLYSKIKTIAPELRTESAGGWPNSQLADVMDIWAYTADKFDPKLFALLRDKGEEVWLYDNPLHGIDRPPVEQRMIGWYLYRYDFDGYLLWGVNAWGQDNPWTTTPGRKNFYRRGVFFYPHPRTGMPLPTLRLEALRRGWEDYQYLRLLKQAAGKGLVNSAEYAAVRIEVERITANLQGGHPDVNWHQLEDLRMRIGELLDAAMAGRNN